MPVIDPPSEITAESILRQSPTPSPVNGSLQINASASQIFDTIGPQANTPENLQDAGGRRVRLRPKPAAVDTVYGSGILDPLRETNGFVFPYQPTITYQQEVAYTQMELVHANQDFYSYSRTPALKMTVEGEFTVQSQQEGRYAIACIHFLRTVTKMWFGGQSDDVKALAGTPPPVLLFDAYGAYMFNSLPVIVTQFSVTLPKDVDYVPISRTPGSEQQTAVNGIYQSIGNINGTNLRSAQGSYTWLPAVFAISVQLTVQNTPRRLRNFDLAKFRSGDLVRGGGWI